MDFEKKEGEQLRAIQEEIKEKEKAELQTFEKPQENDRAEKENIHNAWVEKKMWEKKMKNLISLVILLAGLFVGSIFVDVSQLIKGNGYSQKNLNKADIFEASGKTWVAYDAPAVPMSVISDDTCEKCDPSEVLVWLRRVMPTISVEKVNFDSERGKQLIAKFDVKTLPFFVFDSAVEKTELYTQAEGLFKASNGQDVMDTQLLGVPVGKYLSAPTISADDPSLGNKDSKVKVVVFSDFQCPYCKTLFPAFRTMITKYQDKVEFSFKNLSVDSHPQSADSALAASCAQDQGKFWEYADKLYASQTEWTNAKDITFFKSYATALKLDTTKFAQCLDGKVNQARLDAIKKEATGFAISGTPTIFVNDKVETGVVSADQLTKDIEAELAK